MEVSASPALGARRELERAVAQDTHGPGHPGGLCPSPAPRGPDEPTLARAQGWQDSGETPADLGISQLRAACAFNRMLLKAWGGQEGIPAQRTPKPLSGLQALGTPAPPPGCPSAGPACCLRRTCPCHFYPKSSKLLPSQFNLLWAQRKEEKILLILGTQDPRQFQVAPGTTWSP